MARTPVARLSEVRYRVHPMLLVLAFLVSAFLVPIGVTVSAMVVPAVFGALVLAWQPERAKATSFVPAMTVGALLGGIGGGLLAPVIVGACFRWIAGESEFTIGPLLVSTLPMIVPITNDLRFARRTREAAGPALEALQPGSLEYAEVAFSRVGPYSAVAGQAVGTVLVVAWFLAR